VLDVLRVFVSPDGGGGNPLGVFLEPEAVAPKDRQAVAAQLGYSETVFVTDPARGELRIHTPAAELRFAGHPLVGTAWLLEQRGAPVDVLRPPAGEVPTWTEGGRTWIRGRAEWAPEMHLVQLDAPAAVEALTGGEAGHDFTYAWAWIDEESGTVRSRAFPTGLGIAEDEATGAAAVRLCDRLRREVTIRQGVGSELLARPAGGGSVEVGGIVTHVETRPPPR
jgi:predicted PhzF superfamily epimerase YddE/YHI9